MAEKTSNAIPYLGLIIAVVPILIGLYEYKENNERDFGKNFLNQQSQVYDQLLGDLGSISTSISNPNDSLSQANYISAKFNFNQLYYGRLNLYQSPTIEKLSDSLYNLINSYDSVRAIHKHKEEWEGLIDVIQDKVYKLSVECKNSLMTTYKLN